MILTKAVTTDSCHWNCFEAHIHNTWICIHNYSDFLSIHTLNISKPLFLVLKKFRIMPIIFFLDSSGIFKPGNVAHALPLSRTFSSLAGHSLCTFWKPPPWGGEIPFCQHSGELRLWEALGLTHACADQSARPSLVIQREWVSEFSITC